MSYNPNEPRDGDGEWTSGGGSAKKAAKPKAAPRVKEEAPSEKSIRAKAAHTMIDKTSQRYTENHNEPRFAKAVGGVAFDDNEPIDAAIKQGSKFVHGIELKTLVSNKANKITMKTSAMQKKKAWTDEHGATLHTVVLDDQKVFQAKGAVGGLNPGDEGYADLHDESKRQMYYKRGAGSFQVNAMHPVKNIAELKALMDMKDDELPKAAQPSKSWRELEGIASKRKTK